MDKDIKTQLEIARAEAAAAAEAARREHDRLQEEGGSYGAEHHPSNVPSPIKIAAQKDYREAAAIKDAKDQQNRREGTGGRPR